MTMTDTQAEKEAVGGGQIRTVRRPNMLCLGGLPLLILCSILYFVIGDGSHPGQASSSLLRVFVVFRHGTRAPSFTTYKNDPYKKDDRRYWPAGPGEITKIGKQESYELGRKLRARYGRFLGDYYSSEDVSCYSTVRERTLVTAQVVLAALFPPQGYQRWREDLDWQPVPVFPDYVVNITDDIRCPWFLVSSTAEMQKTPPSEFNFDEADLAVLEEHAGTFEKDPFNFMSRLWDIWDTLYFQEKQGLMLPDWTRTLYPDKMAAAVLKYVKFYLFGTPTRKMIIRGPYGKGLAHFFSTSHKKMELHSWHDMNLFALMTTLGADIERYPEPSSCVAIELHSKDGEEYIEVYHYYNTKVTQPKLLKMPCGTSCLSRDLIKLFESYNERNFDEICNSKSPFDNTTIPSAA